MVMFLDFSRSFDKRFLMSSHHYRKQTISGQRHIATMEPKGGEKIDHPNGACFNTTLPPPLPDEYKEVAWAVPSFDKETNKSLPIEPIWIARPSNVVDKQVRFEMLYCGVCHSDTHRGNNDWGGTVFPFVGGHELLGKVVEIGDAVTKVAVGDYVGVGCMVDSCLDCEFCKSDEEQYCSKGMTMTWDSPKVHGRVLGNPDTYTHGGYSGSSVTHEHFVIKIPQGMDIKRASPILCAGITLWDPIRYHGLVDGPKKVVGIAGLGGLGMMISPLIQCTDYLNLVMVHAITDFDLISYA